MAINDIGINERRKFREQGFVRSYQPINQYIHTFSDSAAQLTNDPSGQGLKLPDRDTRLMILWDAITAGENVSIVVETALYHTSWVEIKTKSVHHGS
jgi:hypothetical protein